MKNPAEDRIIIVMVLNNVSEKRKEDAAKKNFLSLISHKLYTPITVVNMAADVLKAKYIETHNVDAQKAIDTILKKTNMLKELIDKMILFTRISSNIPSFGRDPIKLKSYLELFIAAMVKSVKNKKVELTIDCDEYIIIRIDKEYLGLIIENIIANAIKFNNKDTVKVGIVVTRIPERVKISISDNGPGIPPEDREKIFEKFHQVEKYFTGNLEGIGLGLPLVKSIVTSFKGDIYLESELGKGLTLTITLPS